jgi:hypothetical protein
MNTNILLKQKRGLGPFFVWWYIFSLDIFIAIRELINFFN